MTSYDFARVLTTGAGGLIGSYVDFGIRTDRAELDVLDGEAVMQYVKKHAPRAILHLAGATDTEKCERDSLHAYELNVRGTYNVAVAARAVGATLVYASTSRVFKGDKSAPYTEDDIPEPTSHYARTKYMGELIVSAVVPNYIIARTSWVFGGGPEHDNKFFGNIVKQLKSVEIVALNDVHGSPTYGKDYVTAIKTLLATGERGIFHLSNTGMATRHELASAIVAHIKPSVTVRAVDRSHFPAGALLPSNESMVSRVSLMRPWQEALSEYVSSEWGKNA